MTAGRGRYGGVWVPASVSLVGVVTAYTLWVLGHPYLALGVALISSIVSVNHYIISGRMGGFGPYWALFIPMLLALSIYALFKDIFAAVTVGYVAAVALVIAFSSPSILESVFGDVLGNDDRVVMVLGAAAIAGLTYLYIYGVDADPVGLWVMAGPLVEYSVAKRVLTDSVGEDHPAYTTIAHAYSAGASLMLMPVPFLGAYAILANSIKVLAKGRYAVASVFADYLIRASVLVLLNLGRIPMPATEGIGL